MLYWIDSEPRRNRDTNNQRTFAIAINTENNMGAIQCVVGGPKLVQANPNRPMASRGAATKQLVQIRKMSEARDTHSTTATIALLRELPTWDLS